MALADSTLFPELKTFAPGEARTHGLQIMRLTRCLLRYGGMYDKLLKKIVSEVGFEPTPSSEDQNSLSLPYQGRRLSLESGALDHSAILTYVRFRSKYG